MEKDINYNIIKEDNLKFSFDLDFEMKPKQNFFVAWNFLKKDYKTEKWDLWKCKLVVKIKNKQSLLN